MPGGYLYGWDSVNEVWVKLVCDANGKLKIDPALILENPPTEDEAKKGATSEWCFDHDANVSAHHTKFTAAEAQAACKLDGNLYWSCAGIHFDATYPDIKDIIKHTSGIIEASADGIEFVAAVNLPDKALVTNVIVYGNAAAEAETYRLRRVTINVLATVTMATNNINTVDDSIDYTTVDNSLYAYFITSSSLDTNDRIYGARITYTL